MENRVERIDYEDEIDLREIITILGKRKWLICTCTAVFLLIAGAYSVFHPRIFEISMVIEPGIIDVGLDGKYIYLDTPENIRGRIESSAYTKRIIRNMNLDPENSVFVVKSSIPKSANVIVVSSEFREGMTGLGTKMLNQLVVEIQNDYIQEIKRKRDEYDKQIRMKQNQIMDIDFQRKDLEKQISIKRGYIREKMEQIKVLNANLAIYDQREKDLLKDLKDVRDNTSRLIKQRDEALAQKPTNTEMGMSDLLYSTTIQQNAVFFNELKKQINDDKIEKENLRSYIKTLEKDIMEIELETERLRLQQTEQIQSQVSAVNIEIDGLKNKKELLQNIRMISEPSVSLRPVKPRIMLNILLAIISGVVFGVFLVLFSEYLGSGKTVPKDIQ